MIIYNLNILVIILIIIFLIIGVFFIFKKNIKFLKIILFLISFLFLILWINWFNNLENKKILFVFDTSESMKVEDISEWNIYISRLELVKNTINKYIDYNKNNEFWLVLFSWDAVEVLPFISDKSFFTKTINSVNTDYISKKWSDLMRVFDLIPDYFWDENKTWEVFIFTDGWEDLDYSKLEKYNNKNIKTTVFWVWTSKWWEIPNWKDFLWRQKYLTYNWEKVISKLNSDLEKIWNLSNINYKNLDSENVLYNYFSYIKNNLFFSNLKDLFILFSFLFFILFIFIDKFLWTKEK